VFIIAGERASGKLTESHKINAKNFSVGAQLLWPLDLSSDVRKFHRCLRSLMLMLLLLV
jgi:hypothetical protein